MRRWQPGATPAEFKRIAPATRIYRTDEEIDPYAGRRAAHGHGVRPRAAGARLREHRGARPAGTRVLRVGRARSTCGRRKAAGCVRGGAGACLGALPHSARRRRAERAQDRGQPDRPVLVPRERRRHLNVLVRAQGRGEGMWAAEAQRGRSRAAARCRSRASRTAATLRRGDATSACPARTATRSRTATSARTCSTARAPAGAARSATGARSSTPCATRATRKAQEIPLPHGVDRIEALGANAVVVGTRRQGPALHQPAPRRRRDRGGPLHAQGRGAGRDAQPRLLLQAGERQTPASSACRSSAAAAPRSRQLRQDSAAVLFLRNQALRLTELGRARRAARDAARTTAAAPPAWTGTATRGRSSSATACSR